MRFGNAASSISEVMAGKRQIDLDGSWNKCRTTCATNLGLFRFCNKRTLFRITRAVFQFIHLFDHEVFFSPNLHISDWVVTVA